MRLPASLTQRWQECSAREQKALLLALWIVLVAVLWWFAIDPARRILLAAPAQRRQLEIELQQMQSLQTQARTLQAQPKIGYDEARRLLEASVRPMGAAAQLLVSGERVSVTLKAVSADALAQWLTQVRLNVRAVPSEARLVRNAAGTWDGSLVLDLGLTPAR